MDKGTKLLHKLSSLISSEEHLKNCGVVLNDMLMTGRSHIDDLFTVEQFVCLLNLEKKGVVIPIGQNTEITFRRLDSLMSEVYTNKGYGLLNKVTLAVVGQDCSVLYYNLEMGMAVTHPSDSNDSISND